MAKTVDKFPDELPDEQITRLFDELARSARNLRAFSHVDDTDPEVSNASHHVLKTLEARQPTHAADLAHVLGIGAASMSRHLAELMAAGLVDKRPNDIDARRQVLWVTEAGNDRLEARDQLRRARMAELMPQWDEEQLAFLARSLGELNDTMMHGMKLHRDHDFPPADDGSLPRE